MLRNEGGMEKMADDHILDDQIWEQMIHSSTVTIAKRSRENAEGGRVW